MKKANQSKLEKMDKIISVRMTDNDYGTLLRISKGKKSNVSDVIRTVANVVIDLAKKNN